MHASQHILVCPPEEDLLFRLRGRNVVVNVFGPDQLVAVSAVVRQSGNRLHGLRFFFPDPLSCLPVQSTWNEFPLALYVQEIGPLREVLANVRLLRQMNARLYLPLDRDENYAYARILCSLGVAITVVEGVTCPDWDALLDLATYAILGRVAHALLDPFTVMANQYNPSEPLNVSSVYFNNPARYLHLSQDGKVAFDEEDLQAGRYVLDSVDQLDTLPECPAYERRLSAWRGVFLRFEGCSICPAWRVCLGRMSKYAPDLHGCREYSTELLEILDQQFQRKTQRRKQIWQP